MRALHPPTGRSRDVPATAVLKAWPRPAGDAEMSRKDTWPAQLGVAEEKKKYPANHYKVREIRSEDICTAISMPGWNR